MIIIMMITSINNDYGNNYVDDNDYNDNPYSNNQCSNNYYNLLNSSFSRKLLLNNFFLYRIFLLILVPKFNVFSYIEDIPPNVLINRFHIECLNIFSCVESLLLKIIINEILFLKVKSFCFV